MNGFREWTLRVICLAVLMSCTTACSDTDESTLNLEQCLRRGESEMVGGQSRIVCEFNSVVWLAGVPAAERNPEKALTSAGIPTDGTANFDQWSTLAGNRWCIFVETRDRESADGVAWHIGCVTSSAYVDKVLAARSMTFQLDFRRTSSGVQVTSISAISERQR